MSSRVGVLDLSSSPGFSEPGKAHESDGSMLLKVCFLKACHHIDAVWMGMENFGE